MNRAVPANETAKNPLRQFGGLHHPQGQPLLDVLTQHRGCNPSTVTLQGGSRSLNAYYSTPIYHRVWGANSRRPKTTRQGSVNDIHDTGQHRTYDLGMRCCKSAFRA